MRPKNHATLSQLSQNKCSICRLIHGKWLTFVVLTEACKREDQRKEMAHAFFVKSGQGYNIILLQYILGLCSSIFLPTRERSCVRVALMASSPKCNGRATRVQCCSYARAHVYSYHGPPTIYIRTTTTTKRRDASCLINSRQNS